LKGRGRQRRESGGRGEKRNQTAKSREGGSGLRVRKERGIIIIRN